MRIAASVLCLAAVVAVVGPRMIARRGD